MPDREHRDTRRVDLSADAQMPALAGRLLDVPEPTEEERAAALAEFRRRNAERAGEPSELDVLRGDLACARQDADRAKAQLRKLGDSIRRELNTDAEDCDLWGEVQRLREASRPQGATELLARFEVVGEVDDKALRGWTEGDKQESTHDDLTITPDAWDVGTVFEVRKPGRPQGGAEPDFTVEGLYEEVVTELERGGFCAARDHIDKLFHEAVNGLASEGAAPPPQLERPVFDGMPDTPTPEQADEMVEMMSAMEPSGVPDAPVWPSYPPPGWRTANSQNLRKPWTASQTGDCTHTYETEQGAIDAAWEMATEDANGKVERCTPGDAGLRGRVEAVCLDFEARAHNGAPGSVALTLFDAAIKVRAALGES